MGRLIYSFEHQEPEVESAIIKRKSNELLIDWDSDDLDEGLKNIKKLEKQDIKPEIIFWWPSKSGNIHFKLILESEYTDAEAIALQLFAGSDPVKEIISLKRIRQGLANPIVLYKPLASKMREC